MIEQLNKIRQDVHMDLMKHLVSFLPKICETNEIISKDYRNIDFDYVTKVNNYTTSIHVIIARTATGFFIKNDLYTFDIFIESGIITKIIIDDEDMLIRSGKSYFSNLDMHHLQALRHLYYSIEAFLKNEVSTCI